MKATNDQLGALVRLWNVAEKMRGTGGGNVAAKFLLGLYNGQRFPFDLTELRRFDLGNFEAALGVLQMDFQPEREIHDQLAMVLGRIDIQMLLETFAWDMRLKGAAKKAEVLDLQQRVQARMASQAVRAATSGEGA